MAVQVSRNHSPQDGVPEIFQTLVVDLVAELVLPAEGAVRKSRLVILYLVG